jgi:hypothetical protein
MALTLSGAISFVALFAAKAFAFVLITAATFKWLDRTYGSEDDSLAYAASAAFVFSCVMFTSRVFSALARAVRVVAVLIPIVLAIVMCRLYIGGSYAAYAVASTVGVFLLRNNTRAKNVCAFVSDTLQFVLVFAIKFALVIGLIVVLGPKVE